MAGNVRGAPAPSNSFTSAVSAPWLIWLYCTPVDVPATVTSFAATSSGCPCSRSTVGAASPVHTRPPGRARKRRRKAGEPFRSRHTTGHPLRRASATSSSMSVVLPVPVIPHTTP